MIAPHGGSSEQYTSEIARVSHDSTPEDITPVLVSLIELFHRLTNVRIGYAQ